MAGICIPKSISSKLKEAFASKDISVERLWDMESTERRQVFENYVGEKNAEVVNSEFEKAKLSGFKKAAADYVTSSEKEAFAKKMTGAEFAKKLISDEQKKNLALEKIDQRMSVLKDKQEKVDIQLKHAEEAEEKANFKFKSEKIKGQISALELKRAQIESPVKDRMINKITYAEREKYEAPKKVSILLIVINPGLLKPAKKWNAFSSNAVSFSPTIS